MKPDLSNISCTIKPVLNRTPRPIPANNEYLVPNNFRSRRKDAKHFAEVTAIAIIMINSGATKIKFKETVAPTLRKNIGERKT